MPSFDCYLSLEHQSATAAIETAINAEQAGFERVWAADHFHPWFDTFPDGTKANATDCWTWLPAALERTDELRIGTSGTAFVHRHHPVDVAHRMGSLLELYPDRVFLGLGTGTAMNEIPLGYPWPEYTERARRTAAGIRLFRKLFSESFVSHDGSFWTTEDANLYAGPDEPPSIAVAGGGPTTARLAGDLGDEFLTVYREPETVRTELLPALEDGVEKSDHNDSVDAIERTILLNCSYADDERAAVEACQPLAGSLLPVFFEAGIADPRYIQQHGEKVGSEQIQTEFLVATDANDVIDAVEPYVECGFDRIALHDNGPDSEAFFDLVSRDVRPSFS